MTPEEAKDAMTCMAYTNKGKRCRRRMVCGSYEGGRYVLCAQHARQAGWPVWMWGR